MAEFWECESPLEGRVVEEKDGEKGPWPHGQETVDTGTVKNRSQTLGSQYSPTLVTGAGKKPTALSCVSSKSLLKTAIHWVTLMVT